MATVLDGASLTVTTATDCPNDAGLHPRVSRTAAVSLQTSSPTTLGLEPPYCRDKYRAYPSKPSTHSTWTFFFFLTSHLLSISLSFLIPSYLTGNMYLMEKAWLSLHFCTRLYCAELVSWPARPVNVSASHRQKGRKKVEK